MSSFWQRFLYIILLTVIALVVWGILEAVTALIFYSVGLLLMTVHHIRQLARLDHWLQMPEINSSTVPDASGMWGDVFASLARFAHDHSQNQQRLSKTLERMQRATAAMPDGVVILDNLNSIEWCNAMAERHLGINLELDSGQQITHMVRQLSFAKYLADKRYSTPLILRQSHHHKLVVSLQLVPYGYRQKLLISRDITRFETMETMRRDFIANISHELRTPLTVISGFLETLSEDAQIDAAMNKRALMLMSDQAERMQRLIEDLLTLSRLENSENIVKEKTIDMMQMLHDLQLDAESLSAGRHTIRLNLDTDAQLSGSTDELRSAFSNLVSNAIRYTPDGGEITISWAVSKGRGLFFVEDSGIGIEAAHIPRLTERFYRVDNSRSRKTGGTGLGLAIVKHVLNRHQARLKITSKAGEGSRFNVLFPANRLILSKSCE